MVQFVIQVFEQLIKRPPRIQVYGVCAVRVRYDTGIDSLRHGHQIDEVVYTFKQLFEIQSVRIFFQFLKFGYQFIDGGRRHIFCRAKEDTQVLTVADLL